GVTAGKVRLLAAAPRLLQAEIPILEVAAGKDVEDLELVLRRGSVVAGRVLSPGGEPVTGARVEPAAQAEDDVFLPFFQGTVSDAEGRYRLEGVPDGAVRSFAAEAEGFQRAVREVEVRPGENRLDFRLDAGHEISGRVVDAAGAPIAGALVSTSEPGSPFMGAEGGWGKGVRTGADGSFRLAGVATGVHEVRAGKEGYAPGRLQAVEVAGPVQGLELRLGAAGSVHGRLTGLDLAELAGVEVSAQPLSPGALPGYANGQVDYEGRYRVGGLTAGEWRVEVQAPSGLRASGKVTVPAGGDAVLDLEFKDGFTLTGRVLRGGEPVGEAQVVAMATDSDSHGFSSTGPQGAFRIPGLAPGSYQVRVVNHRGLYHQETVEISGDRDLRIEISGQRVSGRVVDATDQSPIVRARVSLEAEAAPGTSRAASSDDQGAFTLTDVTPGVYRIVARVDGYAPASTPVEVREAGVDGVMLALQPTEGLVLEVRGTLGSPPPQVQVAFLDATGRSILQGSHSTGENGRVRLSSAPPGTWQLLVSASGYATIERPVQVPSPTVAIALPRSSTLTVEAPGLPEHAVVTVTSAGGDGGRRFRSLDWQVEDEWHVHGGKAEIAGLPPGRWRVRVATPDGGQAWQAEVATVAGSPSRVVVR
ncbi:MAG TPA: carboxypeptidase regulatory-like domain-containing protein, partial [Thermoanaerobaculia bacterium]|nr:carboxypeptidase regulatory-like domain-containing protein [Thermoanaerobaculia bacterium]